MIQTQKEISRNQDNWEAVDWFLCRKLVEWTEADELAFLKWSGDEKNFQDFHNYEMTWDALDDLADTQSNISQLSHTKKMNFLRSHRKWVASFAAVAATIAIILFTQILPTQDGIYTTTLSTTVGQQRTLHLNDGSSILLNTDTELNVLYTDKKRTITLDKGEALFDVAKNPNRPFIVTAGKTQTQAIGTQFSVYRKEDGNVRIAVVEGVVKVSKTQGNDEEHSLIISRLTENEMLTLTPRLDLSETKKTNLNSLLSWQSGILDFRATSLEQVIYEVNRYAQKKIIISDDRIKTLEVSGIFRIEDLDTFVSTIENILPVVVEESQDQKLYLHSLKSQE